MPDSDSLLGVGRSGGPPAPPGDEGGPEESSAGARYFFRGVTRNIRSTSSAGAS